YAGKDVRGKIVLAELSYAPPRPEKTRIATVNGAIGLILINWGDDDNPSVPQGTVKPVWGNPTVDNLHLMPNLPAVGIPRLHGIPVRELCKQGTVRARIISDCDRLWKPLHQPHARLGGGLGNHYLLLADHMDSWGGGATDNTSGNAVTLEVARVLADRKNELRRDIQVAFWQAHENGIMEGSTWFVDHYWDEIDRGQIGYINIDSAGMKYATQYEATLSPEFWTMHEEAMRAALGYVTPARKLEKTGDQSFFGIGVPAISGRMEFSKELLDRWHGAILGPWYQSVDDTMDVADKTVLEQDIRMSVAYAWTIATRPVLPYDFRHNARILREALEGYAKVTDDTLGLEATIELAETFEQKAAAVYGRAESLQKRFDAGESGGSLEDDAETLNDAMRQISRAVIPVLGSVVGRYGQDTYGLSALKRWIPSLAQVDRLAGKDPLSGDHMLWWGKLVRERNRVTDAVRALNALADSAAE
ncbi:MAG: M20/M25/M40 family metallo-hydrolase, partial [Thermomicrobiales bacterium]|nr:M20/M25/M40 family metallo-hydrolase [Thermomicrobiales bacterium]